MMDRDEVLKVMRRHMIERPEVLERFQREIRAVAKLRHPNVVTAYYATRIGESIVFAMEFVNGGDLCKRVAAMGPLPADAAGPGGAEEPRPHRPRGGSIETLRAARPAPRRRRCSGSRRKPGRSDTSAP